MKNFETENEECFFNAFKKYFRDRSEFDTCLEKLKTEKDKIVRLGFFYYVVTQEIKPKGITLISIFSIMEATSQEKFQPFEEWLLGTIKRSENISLPIADPHSFKKLIDSLKKEYYSKHGASKKVRQFINNYFITEDKQKLISGFKVKDKRLELKDIVTMLYNERNAFVHRGRLPQIFDRPGKTVGYLQIKGRETYVTIEITINEIQKMFERAFIKFLREKCA